MFHHPQPLFNRHRFQTNRPIAGKEDAIWAEGVEAMVHDLANGFDLRPCLTAFGDAGAFAAAVRVGGEASDSVLPGLEGCVIGALAGDPVW